MQYKLVRVEAPPRRERELICQSCGGPLQNRQNSLCNTILRMAHSDVPIPVRLSEFEITRHRDALQESTDRAGMRARVVFCVAEVALRAGRRFRAPELAARSP